MFNTTINSENLETYIFHYQSTAKTTLHLHRRTFREAIDFVLQKTGDRLFRPYKMVFKESGQTLYFVNHLFEQYLEGKISQIELINITAVDGLFRNKNEIDIDPGIIDAGSLFKRYKDKLILIDDDQYLAFEYPDYNFYQI